MPPLNAQNDKECYALAVAKQTQTESQGIAPMHDYAQSRISHQW